MVLIEKKDRIFINAITQLNIIISINDGKTIQRKNSKKIINE